MGERTPKPEQFPDSCNRCLYVILTRFSAEGPYDRWGFVTAVNEDRAAVPILLLVRLRDHDAPVHSLPRQDALARSVVLVHRGDVPHAGLEFLDLRIVLRTVFQVHHDKLSATLLGCHVVEDPGAGFGGPPFTG